MSAKSVERVSSPNYFADLQLTVIELATLVTGPSNFTTELRPGRDSIVGPGILDGTKSWGLTQNVC